MHNKYSGLALVVINILLVSASFGQSKKVDPLLNLSAKTDASKQIIFLTDYAITSAVNSRGYFPDPTMAGSSIIISFVGSPDPGSEATALNINFVKDSTLYPKPEYIAANKTIYLTMPVSQYPVIVNQIERTIDKINGKKLKGIYLADNEGNSIGVVEIDHVVTQAFIKKPSTKPVPPAPTPVPVQHQ